MPENNDAYQPISFDAIKIGLASPEKILLCSEFDFYMNLFLQFMSFKIF